MDLTLPANDRGKIPTTGQARHLNMRGNTEVAHHKSVRLPWSCVVPESRTVVDSRVDRARDRTEPIADVDLPGIVHRREQCMITLLKLDDVLPEILERSPLHEVGDLGLPLRVLLQRLVERTLPAAVWAFECEDHTRLRRSGFTLCSQT